MKLTFFGGAKAVTGANYMLESEDTKILVDCGLNQGSNFAERKNFDPFPYDPAGVTAVFVTHAHIDHVGRIPKLARDGFRGSVYSTPPTRDFAELMLYDSGELLEKEAEREKKQPICSAEDVRRAMEAWEGVAYHKPLGIGPFEAEFFDAGHILGSSFLRIKAEGKTIIFSGDLGNSPAPIINPTELLPETDYCVIESTYGNREHESPDARKEELENAIEDAVKAGGVLMIPAFAMERTQDLLFHIHELLEEGRVPRVPIFIDSPLAIKLTAVYKKYESYFNKKTSMHIAKTADDILNFPELRLTLTVDESKAINDVPSPKVIVAGSGMSNGGRILHHERRYLPDPKSTLLVIGYQAKGTLGRRLLEGADSVKIFGEEVPVRAHIKEISAYSAHADKKGLASWLFPRRQMIKKTFVVQGDDEAAEAFAQAIRDTLAIDAVVPDEGGEYVL